MATHLIGLLKFNTLLSNFARGKLLSKSEQRSKCCSCSRRTEAKL
ncbi:uncharacterized protein Dmoj_GI26912 [Drosophila mojavensis]|uniref:Uncharacterized protein n=1 Tax=Drosophila mojavensis TaxID=7230 RepID=A0A0Q9XNE3_DROMO|nr:uncharacterized protein Dmoj_GI26912 [Drosophila mojavensis]